MVAISKTKIFIFFIFILVFINGCRGDIGITVYGYKVENAKYIEEAMNEFFNKYSETHLTNEILIKLKHSHLHRYPKDSSRINNSLFYISATTENVRKFFGKMKPNINSYSLDTVGQEGYFRIISSRKNIYTIRLGYYTSYGTPLIELLDAEFADIKYVEDYVYYHYAYHNDYPKARIKEAKAEFESEILPKILECIETVKQRHKENE